ncbi:MAG: hypothetical protein NVS3B26_27280 [Mycobacteriales bacterium]
MNDDILTLAEPLTPPRAGDLRLRNTAAIAGLCFVALSITGIVSLGPLPSVHDGAQQLLARLTAHRDAQLRTTALLSLANGALLIFFAHLKALTSRTQPSSPWPSLALTAAGLLCALGAATSAAPAALAFFKAPGPQANDALLAQQTYYAGNALSAMPAALAVASIALASRTLLPHWLRAASAAVAALQLSSTASLFGSGSTAPDGALTTSALFGSLTLWALAVSLTLLLRRPRT